jgi:hypothetical protein
MNFTHNLRQRFMPSVFGAHVNNHLNRANSMCLDNNLYLSMFLLTTMGDHILQKSVGDLNV